MIRTIKCHSTSSSIQTECESETEKTTIVPPDRRSASSLITISDKRGLVFVLVHSNWFNGGAGLQWYCYCPRLTHSVSSLKKSVSLEIYLKRKI
ncbi:hypothetical protein SLA2020_504490 [Shorea laevis]